jgi:hypothetical protein
MALGLNLSNSQNGKFSTLEPVRLPCLERIYTLSNEPHLEPFQSLGLLQFILCGLSYHNIRPATDRGKKRVQAEIQEMGATFDTGPDTKYDWIIQKFAYF